MAGANFSLNDNDDVQIKGASDGTLIGNSSDRLKVSTAPSVTLSDVNSILKLFYDDMNATNGGVARDTAISTTYVTIYSRSGAGYVFGFVVTFEGNLVGADEFIIKLTVDSVIVAELSTGDLGTAALYNLAAAGDADYFGWQVVNNSIIFKAPGGAGLKYASAVSVAIKKTAATTKRFRAGLIALTKE